jgi:LysR family glycine cleavage system transcriptional activator
MEFFTANAAHAGTNWSNLQTMKDLPLNALRAFAAAHAHGGVRAAARELGVAHSAVSRHLDELARWLGVSLFEEPAGSRRGWRPTAQARALGDRLLAALREIESASAAIREARSPFTVTISTTPSLAARWLLPRLPGLARAHPRIEVSVVVNQRLDDFSAGDVDLALRMGRGPWPGLHCEVLMDDVLVPLLSPSLWQASGRPRDPAQLAGLPLLHDRDPQTGWERWRAAFGPPRLALQRGPRYASSDLLLRAAVQGQGIALARERLAADELDAGTLLRPFGARRLPLPDAHWIVRPPGAMRAAVAAVAHWLKQHVD